jgi:hypothetical protein
VQGFLVFNFVVYGVNPEPERVKLHRIIRTLQFSAPFLVFNFVVYGVNPEPERVKLYRIIRILQFSTLSYEVPRCP